MTTLWEIRMPSNDDAGRSSDDAGLRQHPVPRIIPHAFGFRPGIDLDKLNQLADELEDEAYAAVQRRQTGQT
jgi:hypothetical protein